MHKTFQSENLQGSNLGLGRQRHRWKIILKTVLKETEYGGVDSSGSNH
jgi:hypothetical protein